VPRIDDGSADTAPGRSLKSAWITLSTDEAHDLLEALRIWTEEPAGGSPDPNWQTHITDDDGNELTIAVRAADS
jgi:hypothetical protein